MVYSKKVEFTMAEELRINHLFRRIDQDGNGHLDQDELIHLCMASDFANCEAAASTLQREIVGKDGVATLAAWRRFFEQEALKSNEAMHETLGWFEDMAEARLQQRITELFERLRHVGDSCFLYESGFIDCTLSAGATSMCVSTPRRGAIVQAIAKRDPDKDFKMSLAEFRAVFQNAAMRSTTKTFAQDRLELLRSLERGVAMRQCEI